MVLASEVGVIEIPPEQIERKGRLQPGRMFLVDTEEGRIVVDNEIKGQDRPAASRIAAGWRRTASSCAGLCQPRQARRR